MVDCLFVCGKPFRRFVGAVVTSVEKVERDLTLANSTKFRPVTNPEYQQSCHCSQNNRDLTKFERRDEKHKRCFCFVFVPEKATVVRTSTGGPTVLRRPS